MISGAIGQGMPGTENEVANMDLADFVSMSSFWPPEHVCQPYSWVGHIPFAFWIVEASRPDVLVELGTHTGNSYFSFCQAVKRLSLPTLCHAVDTWEGDEHAGFYGEDVFQAVAGRNRLEYDSFSRLIRSRFDEAHTGFENESIDLLHIDGLHTYEAVKHDFERWLPKMSRRGIVLLHDTNVYERDFGVSILFQELAQRYPTFEFLHSHGLGAIGVGADLPGPVRNLFQASGNESSRESVRACYQRLGQVVLEQCTRADLEAITGSLNGELNRARENLVSAQTQIVGLEHCLDHYKRHCSNLETARQSAESERAMAQEALALAKEQIDVQARHSDSERVKAQEALALAEQQIQMHGKRIQTLEERESTLEAEKQRSREELAELLDRLSVHREQIQQIQQSLGWMLLNRARAVRSRLIRADSGSGRFWTGLTRLFKSEGASVP